MTSIRRLTLFLGLICAFCAGCGLELSLDDVNGIGIPPLAALPPQPAAFPGPPLPLGAQTVLFAQPAPNFNFNANTPIFIPGIGVIYTRP